MNNPNERNPNQQQQNNPRPGQGGQQQGGGQKPGQQQQGGGQNKPGQQSHSPVKAASTAASPIATGSARLGSLDVQSSQSRPRRSGGAIHLWIGANDL
jgi:hypothetical protein